MNSEPIEYGGSPDDALSRGYSQTFPEVPLDQTQRPRETYESPQAPMTPVVGYGEDTLGLPSGLTPWMIVIVILATRFKPIFQALASGVSDSMSNKDFTQFLKEEFESAREERAEFLRSLAEVVSSFEAERDILMRSLETLETYIRAQSGGDVSDSSLKRPSRPSTDYGIRKIPSNRSHGNKPNPKNSRES